MSKLNILGFFLLLNQIIYSQDNRQINIEYVRPIGYLDVQVLIKYDRNSYKIMGTSKQLNKLDMKYEIEITKNEFESYYARFLDLDYKRINELNGPSWIEEDNQLRIKTSDNKNCFKIELWGIDEKSDDKELWEIYDDIIKNRGITEVLEITKEIFKKIELVDWL